MNHVKSEDSSTPREPVYVWIAESQLNDVMKNLERARGRCARQSLAMLTAGHDLCLGRARSRDLDRVRAWRRRSARCLYA
jgi:hypothetical protein